MTKTDNAGRRLQSPIRKLWMDMLLGRITCSVPGPGALAGCLLLTWGMTVGPASAQDVELPAGTYTTLRSARHEAFRIDCTVNAVNPKGTPGKLDLVFAQRSESDYCRLVWDASQLYAEHRSAGNTVRLGESPEPMPDSLPKKGTLTLKCRKRMLEVVANGQRFLRVPTDISWKGKICSFTEKDRLKITECKYQRLIPFTFGDDFMRTEEEAEDLGLWTPVSGEWKLRSVVDWINDNPDARIREGRIPDAQHSVNPFSLSGLSEEMGIVLTGYAFWDEYSFAVSAKTEGGTFGLVFGALDEENFWRVVWQLTAPGIRPGKLQLIHRTNGTDKIIDSVTVSGRTDNWYRLKIKTIGSRLEVFLDKCLLIDARSDYSVGGKIGLFAEGTGASCFDDVSAATQTSVRFDEPGFTESTDVAGKWQVTAQDADMGFRTVPIHKNEQPKNWLYPLGKANWKPGSLQAEVTAGPASTELGLAFAIKNKKEFTRAVWSSEKGGTIKLIRTSSGKDKVLAAAPGTPGNPPLHSFRIRLSENRRVEFYINDTLELRYVYEEDLAGKTGLFATGKGGDSFHTVTAFREPDRDWEKPVDIELFANDPYMQGWASPRWAWIRLKQEKANETKWRVYAHKGDFYGAFRIDAPISSGFAFLFGQNQVDRHDGFRLELEVNGNSPKTGNAVLLKNGRELTRRTFPVGDRTVIPGQQIVDEKLGALPTSPDTVSYGKCVLNRDGKYFWLEVGGKEILTFRQKTALSGLSVGIEVIEPLDFIQVEVLRARIKDYLFERASADWTKIGRWLVTNRFACDPRWSHMNGRSKGTAALWNKFVYQGDYTLEYYAGMRMRQGEMLEGVKDIYYPRMGDINVAFNADGSDLFSGYNLIFSAWDPQWSEKWTQFWRKEKLMKQTDTEFIPRSRSGRTRERVIELEWDPGRRGTHGAWYFIKVRKTGGQFDVSFDNVPVFSVTDPEPLGAGSPALWTQNNSIVIARAKIGYGQRPKPRPYVPKTAQKKLQAASKPESLPLLKPVTHPAYAADFQNGFDGWHTHHPEQGAELIRVVKNPTGKDVALKLRNIYTGGSFGVNVPVSGIDLMSVEELTMDCAIPAGVAVNLYFQFRDDPLQRCFIRLSGPGNNAPNLVSLGNFEGFRNDGKWHSITFRPADALRKAFPWRSECVVENMTMGMLHEGYLNAGKGRNREGAEYLLDNVSFQGIGTNTVRFKWENIDQENLRYQAWLSDENSAPNQPPPDATILTSENITLQSPKDGTQEMLARVKQGKRWLQYPPVKLLIGQPPEIVSVTPKKGKRWDGHSVTVRFDKSSPIHPALADVKLTADGKTLKINPATASYDPEKRLLAVNTAHSATPFEDGKKIEFKLKYAIKSTARINPTATITTGNNDGKTETEQPGLTVTLSSKTMQDYDWTAVMSASRDSTPPGPVRLNPEQYPALDFDDGIAGTQPFSAESMVKISREYEPAETGRSFLSVTNRLCGSDFGITLPWKEIQCGRFPILTFAYRTMPYGYVDMGIFRKKANKERPRPYTVGLTDREESSRKLTDIPGILDDQHWHTAEVNLFQAISEGLIQSGQRSPYRYRPTIKIDRELYNIAALGFGDWGVSANPAGVKYDLDSVRLVPLISSREGYRLSWSAHDASGIESYRYLWTTGPNFKKKSMQKTPETSHEFSELPEGECYFHIGATDKAGNTGSIRSYRFLVDNTPPKIIKLKPDREEHAAPEKMTVQFKDAKSNIDPSEIALKLNGEIQKFSKYPGDWHTEDNSFSWQLGNAVSKVNQPVADGTKMLFEISGIKDFAGNSMPAAEWKWHIDYSKDTTPPLPPTLRGIGTHYQYYDTFAGPKGLYYWRIPNSSYYGDSISRHMDEQKNDECLKITKTRDARRSLIMRYYSSNMRFTERPFMTFDYKVMPGVNVNIMIRGEEAWHSLRITGDDGLPAIGKVKGGTDDGKWHHAMVNIAEVLGKALPKLDLTKLRARLGFGTWNAESNKVGATYYIDNVAIFGDSTPLLTPVCTARDITGITHYRLGVDRNPSGKATRSYEAGTPYLPMMKILEKPGLWFVHAGAKDGGGNWSQTLHCPVYCSEPFAFPKQPAEQLTLEGNWHTIGNSKYYDTAILGGSSTKKKLRLLRGYATSSISKAFTRGFGRDLDENTPFPSGLTASVFKITSGSGKTPVEIRAYVCIADDTPRKTPRRVLSEPIPIEPGKWHENIKFEFSRPKPEPKTSKKEKSTRKRKNTKNKKAGKPDKSKPDPPPEQAKPLTVNEVGFMFTSPKTVRNTVLVSNMDLIK